MTHALYDIWEEPAVVTGIHGPGTHRAQLHGYIGHFPSQGHTERFVATVKAARERESGIQPAKTVSKKK